MIKQGQMGSGQFVGELSFLNKSETLNAKHLFYWNGKPADELTREELLEALIFMSDELRAVRKDRDRWRNAGDVVSYLAQMVDRQRPLTRQQIDDVMTQHYPLSSLLREEVDAFEACVRDLERLHGIGA